jgi:cellulose synthase/poly-beta-1,6-N-acetylglucosamine synthase-like glycosyltransferase
MHIVVVPDGTPRTKPRALNYALQGATGEIVVIYDAEDIPHPQQLRAAARALQAPGHRIGCVQARLGVYNPHASWLTRQFTIEYAALFGALLPALARLDLPLPLGGTSNHFWRSVLEDVGAWDAYNVTEDADLGIRLARFGYEVHVLDSTTGEEAPTTFSSWLKQRTRWLKGWMQTYLVHMRQPRRLRRELGTLRFAGLQILMGGMVLATLVHPWFYVLIAAGAWSGSSFIQSGCVVGAVVWWIGIINFLAGYSSAVALGGVSVRRVGHAELAVHALWMPLYWLAISLAAYRALWQLVTAPFLWEKTEHAARPAAPLVQTGIALRQVPIYRRPRA